MGELEAQHERFIDTHEAERARLIRAHQATLQVSFVSLTRREYGTYFWPYITFV